LFKDAVSAWASNGKAKVNREVEAVSRQTSAGHIGVQSMERPCPKPGRNDTAAAAAAAEEKE
jgi:hypothetical protein